MKAEKFYGDADGPDCVIDRASNGEPLPDLVGWECWGCGHIFVRREDAEPCCADVAAELKRSTTGQPDLCFHRRGID
jgi:hypothetical protein